MATLTIAGKGLWACDGGTITHENVDSVGWSYVVRRGAAGSATVCETLSEAMAELGCDKVEVSKREAAELSRD